MGLAATCSSVVAICACSDGSVTAPTPVACTGDVSVQAASGAVPTFTWRPACKAFALLVEEGAHDRWYVRAQPEGIAPSVRYGVVPVGAVEKSPADPLRSGGSYDFVLFRGTSESDMVMIGHVAFTP